MSSISVSVLAMVILEPAIKFITTKKLYKGFLPRRKIPKKIAKRNKD